MANPDLQDDPGAFGTSTANAGMKKDRLLDAGGLCEQLRAVSRAAVFFVRMPHAACSTDARLVLHDFRDGTHRALFHTVTASDAGVFIDHDDGAVNDFENVLRAGVNADAAADAFVFKNYGMRHCFLFSLRSGPTGCRAALFRFDRSNRDVAFAAWALP